MIEVARLMTSRGWCREASGNISMIIEGEIEVWDADPIVFDTNLFLPQLEGKLILMTRSGSHISDIPEAPEEEMGLYLAGKWGRYLTLIWGAGAPTSEYLSHLLIYSADRTRTRAVIHSHMEVLEDLGQGSETLSAFLPDWIGWVPRLPPGSLDLARATVQEMGRYDLMYWEGHGIVAPGKGVDDCLSRLERFEEWARALLIDM